MTIIAAGFSFITFDFKSYWKPGNSPGFFMKNIFISHLVYWPSMELTWL